MSDGNAEGIPETWVVARLEDLLVPLGDGRLLHHGWSPQCEKEPAGPSEWAVLKTTALQPGDFQPEHNKRLPTGLQPRPQHEVKPGDLLITCAGPRVRCGIPCLVRSSRPKLMLSGKMYRFRVSDEHFDARYLEKYLLSPSAQTAIDAMKTGGNESGLNLTHDRFKPLPVPVAPLEEQHRIASRIDELFSRIEEGERALKRVQTQVERYRQSVLKAAVTGQLTREWRKQNKEKLESGEALLGRVLRARREVCEKAELEKMKAKGMAPSNDKWKQKYEELTLPDATRLPALPAGWLYVNIDVLVEPVSGSIRRGPFGSTLTKSIFVSAGYKVYEQQHAISGDFSAGKYYIDEEKYKELSSFVLRPGDLIISCSGTVGRIATVPNDAQPGVINQALLKLTLAQSVIDRDFFKLAFEHRLAAFSSRGTGMNNFSGIDELKKMPFPLPPLAEQTEILQQAYRLFSVLDHQAGDLRHQADRARSLRQAVLRQAFRGALVRQIPSEEPASQLLQRIAAERRSHTTVPKRGRRTKSTT